VSDTLLGERYQLDELIGRGGMATVWRATDTVLNRPVAVKRLHAGLVADDELTERFRREALMVARLSHPNLVHVLDRGDDADGPYLVLELVEGENLKSRIRREGPLPAADAARICAQVAHALEYAHGQGVVHRDIKAQNVLLSPDGTAKLADFGIARMMEADGEAGLTRTDMLLGSADYLSPEQANGHALDARSDVYSLGIVLFEALTATLPFMGEGFVAVAMKHCSEPLPDPRTVVAGIPPWVAAIVLRATDKDPAQRFPTAGAMAAALEAGPAGDGGTAIFPRPAIGTGHVAGGPGTGIDTATARRPMRRRRGRALALATAILLVAVALGGAGIWIARDGMGGADTPAEADPADATELTITAVRDFDPPSEGGDGQENPGQRDLAIDGDPETAWLTERYQDTPTFGGLKDGVGLLLRLDAPAVVTEARILSPTPGATFELQAVGSGGTRPTLAEGTFDGTLQTVTATQEAAAQSYVVWITGLAPAPDGGYQAGIADVTLRGVPEGPAE
jgi:eukaryotic-like serine/threonine-protein kinase